MNSEQRSSAITIVIDSGDSDGEFEQQLSMFTAAVDARNTIGDLNDDSNDEFHCYSSKS